MHGLCNITTSLNKIANFTTLPQQSGFSAGRSTTNTISIQRLLSDSTLITNSTAHCMSPVYCLDIKFAFDSADHAVLWKGPSTRHSYPPDTVLHKKDWRTYHSWIKIICKNFLYLWCQMEMHPSAYFIQYRHQLDY